ncbi:GNAT family N-acetyltransferase [Falsochrobactrum sp. TDYN1]|uniref:GNAT family N-acetyltransferase n=1 Tax=Falsochrobactrum tianjinense TaxID=2706015 RepID=A0A949PRH7_9HYPH|nr:GNAT family N-acetyltransferase [Falsochrobactrum sp. TDYN1]MBV2143555.1 GNAT family N-acetyltransferase [Falsochrobactrum sp. TDYN1]
MSEVVIRELASLAEMKDSENVQHLVWGEDDPVDASDLLLAIQHEGGLVAGAFADQKMVGFIFGFPSATPGVQHSHRLAVLPEARGLKLGARMKWFQRDWCLARGITLVRWTYDPIRAINAGLNIASLGATSSTYHVDYYGPMVGINSGLPSDRIVADWQLDDPHVEARSRGQQLDFSENARRVEIPHDIEQLLSTHPAAALNARLSLREALLAAFDQGQRIVGFDTKAPAYLVR